METQRSLRWEFLGLRSSSQSSWLSPQSLPFELRTMTTQEALNWLYAIETLANDAGEVGDWVMQDFGLEWFAAVREHLA